MRATHILLLAVLLTTLPACHNTTTEPIFVGGYWDEFTSTTCNSAREGFLLVQQSGDSFTAESPTLQATLQGRIQGSTLAVQVTWHHCSGTPTGTLTFSGNRVEGTLDGPAVGDASQGCCGENHIYILWARHT